LLIGVAIALPGIVVMGFSSWHVVFENTATSRSYGVVTITNGHGVSIGASQVTVTSDAGIPVAVGNSEPNESITRNSDHYTSAVEFTTPHLGRYVLRSTRRCRGR
jgi:hypothetical protein